MKEKLLWSVALSLFICGQIFSASYTTGTIVLKNGTKDKISKICVHKEYAESKKQHNLVGYIRGSINKKSYTFEFEKLNRIEYLGEKWFKIYLKDGREFKLRGYIDSRLGSNIVGGFDDKVFQYAIFDDIELKSKILTIRPRDIVTIVFNDDIGRIKYNKRKKEYFPAEFIFDPYTGEKLIWHNFE